MVPGSIKTGELLGEHIFFHINNIFSVRFERGITVHIQIISFVTTVNPVKCNRL